MNTHTNRNSISDSEKCSTLVAEVDHHFNRAEQFTVNLFIQSLFLLLVQAYHLKLFFSGLIVQPWSLDDMHSQWPEAPSHYCTKHVYLFIQSLLRLNMLLAQIGTNSTLHESQEIYWDWLYEQLWRYTRQRYRVLSL